MAAHELALCVINDGAHYKARCGNYRTMPPEKYREYIRGLVDAESSKHRVRFGKYFPCGAAEIATGEVVEYMQQHMKERDAAIFQDALKAKISVLPREDAVK